MLHGQIVLGHLSTVKDGSTNLKCLPRYFPWGGGGGGDGWRKVEINAISAQHSWNWAQLELGLSLAKLFKTLVVSHFFSDSKLFWIENFVTVEFFSTNYISLIQIFFGPLVYQDEIFGPKLFLGPFFSAKIFFWITDLFHT